MQAEADFRRLAALVQRCTGIQLSEGKKELLNARLRRRLQHYGFGSLRQYYQHLVERDPDGCELAQMVDAITTNRTDFFREQHHFEFFAQTIAGAARCEQRPRFRVWSAGCSSGEEAYTIACVLLDAWPEAAGHDVRILASDIDRVMLGRAQEGVYPVDRIASVPGSLRDRYFLRGRGAREGFVRVRDDVRRLVTFRSINLSHPVWPVRTKFDVIFCRNVLIYFDRRLQQQIIESFVNYLNPSGYLLLGHSESLLGMRPGLRYVGRTIYQRL